MQDSVKKQIDEIYERNIAWKNSLYEIIQLMSKQKHVKTMLIKIIELFEKEPDEKQRLQWLKMVQPVFPTLIEHADDKIWLSGYLDHLYDCKRLAGSGREMPGFRQKTVQKAKTFTKKECQEWMANKEKNPRTKRSISPTGRVAKELKKMVIELGLTSGEEEIKGEKTFTKKECQEWMKKKDTNPKTKRKISPEGRIYKELKKKSQDYGIKFF